MKETGTIIYRWSWKQVIHRSTMFATAVFWAVKCCQDEKLTFKVKTVLEKVIYTRFIFIKNVCEKIFCWIIDHKKRNGNTTDWVSEGIQDHRGASLLESRFEGHGVEFYGVPRGLCRELSFIFLYFPPTVYIHFGKGGGAVFLEWNGVTLGHCMTTGGS